MGNTIAEKDYEINYYEINFRKELLVTSLINYFEDTATKHSEDIGCDLDYMKKNGVCWVLYKWDIDIRRYPVFRERIKVRTKACSLRKFYAYRTFDVFDSNGNVICSAKSVWILIDTNKRKAKRITEDMYVMYGVTKEDNKALPIEKVILPNAFNFERKFDVMYSDIDTNRHVNNGKYINWAVETVPLNIVLDFYLKNLNITYKKEAVYGESIISSTKMEEEHTGYTGIHKISNEQGKELCIIKTVWERRTM